MKILYLSCHSILEYDELKLFKELGYDFFSMGAYMNPNKPQDEKRPAIEVAYTSELDHLISVGNRYSKDNLHPDLIEPFDIIIAMHIPDWIVNNWNKIKHKKVIWRSIGQSTKFVELDLTAYRNLGLRVVRYSPKELEIPNNIGSDKVIRFYKDEKEFSHWNGGKEEVVTIAQSMKQRGLYCGFDIFEEVTRAFPRKLYGPDNDVSGIEGGLLSYDQMKIALQDARVYFYTGTYPASYTLNFIEAMMTGIPIISIGPKLADIGHFPGNQFEIGDIIKNGVNGFISDDKSELRDYIIMLMKDIQLARKIGAAGRQTAIELFGKEKVKAEWKTYLESV